MVSNFRWALFAKKYTKLCRKKETSAEPSSSLAKREQIQYHNNESPSYSRSADPVCGIECRKLKMQVGTGCKTKSQCEAITMWGGMRAEQ